MATTRARTSTKRATIMAEPFSGPAPRPSDDRRVPPRKQEDAPAEDTIDDEAEQAQHQQRHEDVVHQHVEARVPEHLAEAVVGGDQLGGHDGDEGVGHRQAHPGQDIGHRRGERDVTEDLKARGAERAWAARILLRAMLATPAAVLRTTTKTVA